MLNLNDVYERRCKHLGFAVVSILKGTKFFPIMFLGLLHYFTHRINEAQYKKNSIHLEIM